MGRKLVVIIPAYDEEGTVARVVSGVPKKLSGIAKIENYVIDDGSKDKTALFAARAGARVISHLKNKGLGMTFAEGIDLALARGADIVVNVDADNQWPPAQMERIVLPIIKGNAEVVLGSRFMGRKMSFYLPWAKRFGNKVLAILVSFLIGQRLYDVTCGFRAFSREAALNLNLMENFTYTQESILTLAQKGYKIMEVPIFGQERKWGKTKIAGSLFHYGVRASLVFIRGLRDRSSLKFFGFPGLVFLCLGFIGLLFILIYYLVLGHVVPFRSVLTASAVLFITGSIVVVFALLADLQSQIRRNQERIIFLLKKEIYGKGKFEI